MLEDAFEEAAVEGTVKAAEEEYQEADEEGLEEVIKSSAVKTLQKNILRQL